MIHNDNKRFFPNYLNQIEEIKDWRREGNRGIVGETEFKTIYILIEKGLSKIIVRGKKALYEGQVNFNDAEKESNIIKELIKNKVK